MLTSTSLPYTDTKPQGAADFYLCINATFRFIRKRLGVEGLRRYWSEIGAQYYRPVTEIWKAGGLPSVARYWRDFFDAEPGSEVEVVSKPEEVVVEVRTCPAIAHLRAGGREIEADFCQHCYFVSEEIASRAGLTVRVEGGAGRCTQRFFAPTSETSPQDLQRIHLCS